MSKSPSSSASHAASPAPSGASPAPGRAADWPLRILVFIAGFVLMGFEIAGSRVLAPTFGNSVYVWGALIGVVLAALGLGYWFGGVIADRWPSRRLLGAIGLCASAGILAAPFLGPVVCDAIGERYPVFGPVLASVALFLAPSLLLGVVSPFAIRLQTRAIESVGRTAGLLYALSTIGSFAGTFVTTFALIPWVGTAVILKCLGGALMAASAAAMVTRFRDAIPLSVGLVVAAFWMSLQAPRTFAGRGGELVQYEVETPYHFIFVTDDDFGSRYLRFNHHIESQIGPAPEHAGRSAYTQFFHLVPAFAHPLRRVCFIGAGGGVGPREFLQAYPGVRVDCVDIDPVVLRVCQDYFYVPRNHPDLAMIERDGRIFFRGERGQGPYDAVVLDAFTTGGRIPFHLTTLEYFKEIRERLAPGGVLLMNVISALEGSRSAIARAVHRTMSEAFGDAAPPPPGGTGARHVFTFDVHRYRPDGTPASAETTRNVIFVAARTATTLDAAVRRAEGLAADRKLRDGVPGLLSRNLVKPMDFNATLLTDDYAPIETMPLY
jgi:spermidine synthase